MVLLSTSNPVAVWKKCFSSTFRTIPSNPALSTPPSCRAKCSFLVASRENVDFFLRGNHRAWRIWLWSSVCTSEFPEWWRSLVFLSLEKLGFPIIIVLMSSDRSPWIIISEKQNGTVPPRQTLGSSFSLSPSKRYQLSEVQRVIPGIQISESPRFRRKQPDGRKTTKISSLVDGAQRNPFQSHRFFATLSLQHQSSWQNFRG